MTKRTKIIIGKVIILVAVLALGTTISRAVFDSNPILYFASSLGINVSSAETAAVLPRSPLNPNRLQIPSLGINTSVQYIGVKTNGQLSSPSNFTNVGWYKNGPAPGQGGTAVIDGHVDNGLALPGVFKHLNDMKVGDSVYVVNNAGKKLKFVVTDIKTYPYNSPSPDNIFVSEDHDSHLNLITCTGDWIVAGKTYNERLVVYTSLVT